MKNLILNIAILLLLGSISFAQVGINNDNSLPDPSAGLDVKFISKGMLIPRMTTAERNSIASPAFSLMIFNTTTRCIEAYNANTSAWETVHCFQCPIPVTPVAITHVPSQTAIVWNWNPVTYASGYKWNTTNNYNTAIDMGTAMTKLETGLTCNTPYTSYAWAYNACGNSTPVTLTQSTLPDPPGVPAEGIHVPSTTQIVWNWSTVQGATGYKWSTTNDYASATNTGAATSWTETGLAQEIGRAHV